MFKDYVKIYIKSGKGGDGAVSFRRELYVPNGGPDGGDGGKGGDIIFEVDNNIHTLSDFYHNQKFKAENGEDGRKRKCHGANGKDLIIKVPPGTLIKEFETGKIIRDMSGDNKREIILQGGKGGIGNMHYATSTMQAPKYAKPGGEAKELNVILELKSIADVGLLGLPSAGKSTLISKISNARPQIADYPFTTLNPHLGVVKLSDNRSFVMADLPGLIEGASEGKGLGDRFLRHVERNKLLLHLVDLSYLTQDPIRDIELINNELRNYSDDITEIEQIIVGTKKDIATQENINMLDDYCKKNNLKFFVISAATGENIKELLDYTYNRINQKDDIQFATEFDTTIDIKVEDTGFTITKEKDVFVVSGNKIDKMMGYTNLDTEKGFLFFQKFIREQGIEEALLNAGIEEGDTVSINGYEFEFYK